LGLEAGTVGQNISSVSIGTRAGQSGQYANSIAIGVHAAQFNQENGAVSVGELAGQLVQNSYAVAIGSESGRSGQFEYAIAIGSLAGTSAQGSASVAIGQQTGQVRQSNLAVAIGYYAAQAGQGSSAISIGSSAGSTSQGSFSIAIGAFAGQTSQASNSIILNASGVALDTTVANTFVVNPVRFVPATQSNIMVYNTSTSEIAYSGWLQNTNKDLVIGSSNVVVRNVIGGVLGYSNNISAASISASTGFYGDVLGNASNVLCGTVYGPIAAGNTISTTGVTVSGSGTILGASSISASTAFYGSVRGNASNILCGTVYGPIAAGNTISTTGVTVTGSGTILGASSISASTGFYGDVLGNASNILCGTVYGPIAAGNTISGTSLTLTGTALGATSVSASTGFFGSVRGNASNILCGTVYGPIAAGNTVAGTTVSASTAIYGTMLGSNVINVSTIVSPNIYSTSILGTAYPVCVDSNGVFRSTFAITMNSTSDIAGVNGLTCTTIYPTSISDGTSTGSAYRVLTTGSSAGGLSWELPMFPISSGSSTSSTTSAAVGFTISSTFFPADTTFKTYRLNVRVTAWTTSGASALYVNYDNAGGLTWNTYSYGPPSRGNENGTTNGCIIALHDSNASYTSILPYEIDVYISNPYITQRKTAKSFSHEMNGNFAGQSSAPMTTSGICTTTTASRVLYFYSEYNRPALTVTLYPWS
jgi:hypothetical protein